jgi:hypothetical protein
MTGEHLRIEVAIHTQYRRTWTASTFKEDVIQGTYNGYTMLVDKELIKGLSKRTPKFLVERGIQTQ